MGATEPHHMLSDTAFVPRAAIVPVTRPARKTYRAAEDLTQRRKVRTIMLDDVGLPTGAQIDMTTGEVRPHAYKDYSAGLRRPKPNPDAQDLEPFWMKPLPDAPELKCSVAGWLGDTLPEVDKSRKKQPNRAKDLLHDYLSLGEAVEDYPALDHIICGATALELGGATRGLNRAHVFTLLQHLDVISPATVRDFAGHSKSHSEKVAVCLRIVSTAFTASVGRRELSLNPSLT
jgi:hypothetical protein